MRLHLLQPEARLKIQELFRHYVDSRLETYRRLPDMQGAAIEMAKSKELHHEIWNESVAASRTPNCHPDAGKLLLPAFNNMIDITNARAMALQMHPPQIIYLLLFALGLLCSLLTGYRMAGGQRRSWLHILAFVIITVIVVYVMLDIEYPRIGLIRHATTDQLLIALRKSMEYVS